MGEGTLQSTCKASVCYAQPGLAHYQMPVYWALKSQPVLHCPRSSLMSGRVGSSCFPWASPRGSRLSPVYHQWESVGRWFYEVISIGTPTWACPGLSYLPKSCGQYLPD